MNRPKRSTTLTDTQSSEIIRIQPDNVPRPLLGHPQAVAYDRFVFVSGQMSTDYETGIVPAEAARNEDFPYWQVRMDFQAARIIETIKELLGTVDATLDDTAKVVSFHTDLKELPSSMMTRTKYFRPEGPAASTAVGISALPVINAGFEFELIGFRPDADHPRRAIHTESAPVASLREMYRRPIFSQAVRAGDFVFTQGSIASDFKAAIAPEAAVHPSFPYYSSEIRNQTVFALRALGRILEAAGSSLKNVVKADVYMTDMKDYPGMDQGFREVFVNDPPARSVVPIRELVVTGSRIEISVVAVADDGKIRKEVIESDSAPDPLGCESQAVKAGPLVFLSTLVARDSRQPGDNGKPYISPAEAETEEVVKSAQSLLRAAGTDIGAALRLRAFFSDLSNLRDAYNVWNSHVADGVPAFTAVGVPSPLVLGQALCQFDLIAASRT